MDNESIIHIQIEAPTLAELKAFTDEIQPDLGCRAIPRQIEGKFIIDAYLGAVRKLPLQLCAQPARLLIDSTD